MTVLLRAEGLVAGYGGSQVLQGTSIEVTAGTSLGLLGRNGMGKTTLIRRMMGYLRPSAGRVHWGGRDVTGQAPERMARLGIGYVPEGRGIFPNLSVRESLVMCERAGPEGRRDWTLERVLQTFPRLTERLQHGGQQLSGGEQQMLSIGRALLTNPSPGTPARRRRACAASCRPASRSTPARFCAAAVWPSSLLLIRRSTRAWSRCTSASGKCAAGRRSRKPPSTPGWRTSSTSRRPAASRRRRCWRAPWPSSTNCARARRRPAVVTHGGVLRVLFAHWLEVPPRRWPRLTFEFGGVSNVIFGKKDIRVEYLNRK